MKGEKKKKKSVRKTSVKSSVKKDRFNYFKFSLDYLKLSKNYIYLAMALFFVSAILGFVFSEQLGFFDSIIKDLLDKTQGLNTFEIIIFIFGNNVLSALNAVVLGLFLGIFPLVSIITNGALLGYVFDLVATNAGPLEFWRILPHGIFELPAIFIAVGVGTKMGFALVGNYFRHYWKDNRLFIWLPFGIGVVFGILSVYSVFAGLIGDLGLPYEIIYPLAFLSEMIFVFVIFIVFSMIFNKDLRRVQSKSLAFNVKGSLLVFLNFVVPLLIVAAIIEGILIGLAI